MNIEFIWLCLAFLFSILSMKYMQPTRAIAISLLICFFCVPLNVHSWGVPYNYLFSRLSAPQTGLLIGMILYRREMLKPWPFSWIDLPMLIYIFMPLISLAGHQFSHPINGLIKIWWSIAWLGFPYYMARLVFKTKEDLIFLSRSLVVFGLFYAIPGIYESFVGPENYIGVQLLDWPPPANAYRLGGFRPSVLLDGLTFCFFFAWIAVAAWWMFIYADVYGRRHLWAGVTAALLLGCEVWFRGVSGYVSTIIGFTCMIGIRKKIVIPVMLAILLMATSYMGLRVSGKLDRNTTTYIMKSVYPPKAGSLGSRLRQEDRAITEIKSSHPLIGHSPKELYYWADGWWISSITEFGYLGLSAWWMGMICMPICIAGRYAFRKKTEEWVLPAGLAILLLMYGCDSLINHPLIPLCPIYAAAILTFCSTD